MALERMNSYLQVLVERWSQRHPGSDRRCRDDLSFERCCKNLHPCGKGSNEDRWILQS